MERGQAERICREALDKPDRHAALRWLRDALPSMDSRLPGLRNEGFLATHELAVGARRLDAWPDAERKARPLLQSQGNTLFHALGFEIEAVDQVTSILRAGTNERKTAVAVLLRQDESPELSTPRFSGLSPVSYALAVADRENIPYVLISQGSKLRLYPAKVGVGVGRRGRTETYVEVHTGLLRDSDAAFLWLLFSAEALAEGGSLTTLLEESNRFAGDLAHRLRERIYGAVIPRLAEGLAVARGLRKPTAQDFAETYQMATMVLFRLLFIAYAEDEDLLPFKFNDLYKARSLKVKAQELLKLQLADTPFDKSTSLWEEVSLLCRAVDEGKAEWGVPAYDGGLFSRDKDVSPLGALLDKLTLPNTIFGHVLRDLLVIQSPEGWGPVDFRSLNVGEFGTIYQGLLESELAIAETDLTVDKKGFYRPCLDWYTRRFVERSLNYFLFNPLPVPPPPRESILWQRVVALAGHLAAVDNRFAKWAQAVGVECGPLNATSKLHHIHELDAVVAHLYALTEPQLVHIFETFHEGWDYADRLEATLKHFHAWKKRLP